jgi:ABC-type uncharacterized transport system permease subunit
LASEVHSAAVLAFMDSLRGITLTCFATSYAVALALELSRLWFRSPVRAVLLVAFAVLGLFTHTVFLVNEAQSVQSSAVLSSWHDWFLVAAWVLAAAYLYLAAVHPGQSLGMFLLPLVLALIGAAHFLADRTPFPHNEALRAWASIHGLALLLGTVVVFLGFAAGTMYLLQDRRLRQKRPLSGRFRLPSLEWLDRVNSRALTFSVVLLALGVLSGLVLNQLKVRRDGAARLPLSDPVVWTSLVLLVWLLAASTFGAVYKPARVGRKVAYMTLASFAFLAMVLAVLLLAPSDHNSGRAAASGPAVAAPAEAAP